MFSAAAKAWVALIGSVIAVFLASPIVPMDSQWHNVLGIVAAILAAGTTYAVPNRPATIP